MLNSEPKADIPIFLPILKPHPKSLVLKLSSCNPTPVLTPKAIRTSNTDI